MIYFFCLLLLLMLCIIYKVVINRNLNLSSSTLKNDHKYLSMIGVFENKCLFVVFLYLIAIVSLRNVSVGWDTVQYQQSFDHVQSFDTFQQLLRYRLDRVTTVEWGYLILEWIVSRFFPFQFFLSICACLYIIPVYIYIIRYSDNKFFSTYIFITYGMYIFCFSTIRQSIAMGIAVIAVMEAHKHKLIKSIIIIIIAINFHRTALIFIPSLIYDRIKLNRKTIVAILVITVVAYLERASLLAYMLGYARNNGGEIETGGMLQYLFVMGMVTLGIIYWKEIKSDQISVFLFVSQCFVLAIIPVLRVSPTNFRVFYYNYLFVSIYIPNLLSRIKRREIVYLVYIMVFFIGLYYFYNQILKTNNPLIPYEFFWQ